MLPSPAPSRHPVPRPAGWRRGAPYAAIAAAILVLGLAWPERNEAVSWHYFNLSAHVLFSGDGLHLFARHPQLQFGPLAAVASEPVRLIGGHDAGDVAGWLLAAALLPLLWVVEHMAVRAGAPPTRARTTVFIGGLLVLVPWSMLAFGTGHIDDALALGASVVALWAILEDHPVGAAILLALAVDAKPWALAFVPLLLVFSGRARRLAVGTYAGLLLIAWLPFLLADPNTLDASRFTIHNSTASALRWLGVRSPRTPSWDRSAQVLLGGAAAAAVVLRRMWPAALLAAISVRILLDPGTRLYYAAGLLLAALVFDVMIVGRRIPWTTVVTFVLVVVPSLLAATLDPAVRGAARALGTLIPLALIAWYAWRGPAGSGGAAPLRFTLGDEGGQHPFEHDRPVDDALGDVFPAGEVVHDLEQHVLENRA